MLGFKKLRGLSHGVFFALFHSSLNSLDLFKFISAMGIMKMKFAD
jgi:hypothetical protein